MSMLYARKRAEAAAKAKNEAAAKVSDPGAPSVQDIPSGAPSAPSAPGASVPVTPPPSRRPNETRR